MKSNSLAIVTLDAALAARAGEAPRLPLLPGQQLVTCDRLELAFSKDGEPPTACRLFAAGFIETTKGTFKFDSDSASSVMKKAQDQGNDLCFDYDHAMNGWLSVDPAASGKSAGWFTPEIRDGELWAAGIQWTPRAKQMLKDREYRYCSPTFIADDEGRILELINVALTNLPATKRMEPLMASRAGEPSTPKEKPAMKTLLVALGLADTASEAEALAALTKSLEVRGKLFALTGKTTTDEAFAVVEGFKAAHTQLGVYAARVAEIEKAAVAAELEALITTGRADGKLAPAMVEWAKTQSPKALKSFLEVAPKLVPEAKKAAKDDAPEAVELTAVEEEIIRTTGTDRKKFIETKLAAKKAAAAAA